MIAAMKTNKTHIHTQIRETNRKNNIKLIFDLDDLDLSKNEPLKLISGVALHLPSKFGEDRPKDLGGVGEQTNKQTNKQADKRCSNYKYLNDLDL